MIAPPSFVNIQQSCLGWTVLTEVTLLHDVNGCDYADDDDYDEEADEYDDDACDEQFFALLQVC